MITAKDWKRNGNDLWWHIEGNYMYIVKKLARKLHSLSIKLKSVLLHYYEYAMVYKAFQKAHRHMEDIRNN